MPVVKLVHESMARHVAVASKEVEREEKRRRALKALEYIKSNPDKVQDIQGITNVSVHHDKDLNEQSGHHGNFR